MDTQELETLIKESLEDFKLDKDEKNLFKSLSENLEDEQVRFIRNKAFELSRAYIIKGGLEANMVFSWLEKVVRAIQPTPGHSIVKSGAYFSPGEDCRKKIISLLSQAKKKIDICVFTISDNKIVAAILEAHNRGIQVTIISDNDKSNDKGSDIDYLSDKGVTIILDRSRHHMHHKFAIFDEQILLNGSFNWTRSATEVNEENILVTGERKLVSAYNEKFQALSYKLKKGMNSVFKRIE